jgi:hypothetical protein
MRILKLDNGEIVVCANDYKMAVVFNKKIGAESKYIEVFAKDIKLFDGRDALYVSQKILGEINLFCSLFSLLIILKILTNVVELALMLHLAFFVIGIFLSLKCAIQINRIQQDVELAYLDNHLSNLFESIDKTK